MAQLPPWPFLDGGAAAVEVRSELDGDVLEVRYLAGESAPLVDGDGALCLRHGDAGFELVVPRACDGWVAARGRLVTLGELRQCGVAAVPIGPRTEACVRVGVGQFRVAGTTPPRRHGLAPRIAWRRSTGAAVAALAGVFCALWLLGEPRGWQHRLQLKDVRLMRVRLEGPATGEAPGLRPGVATMRAPASQVRMPRIQDEGSQPQAQPQKHTPTAVSQNRDSSTNKRSNSQSANEAPARAKAMDRASARALAMAQARAAGALGVVGADGRSLLGDRFASYGAPAFATASLKVMAFGDGESVAAGAPGSSGASSDGASSSDSDGSDSDANGALEGDAVGEAYGVGGLGLEGGGPGGGGSDDGTIGLGNLGTIGHGGGEGYGSGYGSGAGGLGGRRAQLIDVEGAAAVTDGGCGRDWIRRVVRAHLNELKFCYERDLQQDPTLSGRVVEHFVIEPGGRVIFHAVARASVDARVLLVCVDEAVGRWRFPGCNVAADVTYPFTFVRSE